MECFGRNTDVPSTRWNAAGLDGGVIRNDAHSAASTTSPITASRSDAEAKRCRIVWRAASAVRFQCRQVARFSLTAVITLNPSTSIASRGTSSARSTSAEKRPASTDHNPNGHHHGRRSNTPS